MAVTYSITDTFIAGGVGQNGLTASAYANSRFTTPPAKNAAAPSGAADGTATTGSSYGNDGSFQITGLAAGLYWVAITYSATTYWKLYTVGGAPFGAELYGLGLPSNAIGNTGDQYTDLTTGIVYGPKLAPTGAPAIRGGAVGAGSVTIPASVQTGDQLLLIATAYSGGFALPTPTGWTLLVERHPTNRADAIFYKTATGTDAGTVVNWNAGTGYSFTASSLLAISGSNLTAPTVGTGVAGTAAGTSTVTLPATTPPSTAAMALMMATMHDNVSNSGLTSSPPAGSGAELEINVGSDTALSLAIVLNNAQVSNTWSVSTFSNPQDPFGWPVWINQSSSLWPSEGNITPTKLPTAATAPASPVAGQRYFDTVYNRERMWDGTSWVVVGASMLYGTGAPSNASYSVGDQYTDTSSGIVYGPKTLPVGAPAIRASAVGTTGGSGTVTIPASVQIGDLMIVTAAGVTTATPPAGWTTLSTQSAGSHQQTVSYKFAVSGDPGSTITFSDSAGFGMAVLTAVYGSNLTAPTVGSPVTVTSGTTITLPSTAPPASASMTLAAVAGGGNVNGITITWPTPSTALAQGWESGSYFALAGLAVLGTPNQSNAMTFNFATTGAAAWPVYINQSTSQWPSEGVLPGGSATQATLTGTTAGTAVSSQPFQSGSYKKFIVYLNGYENTTATAQTITFPTAFSHTPYLAHDDSGGATVSTTTLTLPASMGTTKTGWIVVEGF